MPVDWMHGWMHKMSNMCWEVRDFCIRIELFIQLTNWSCWVAEKTQLLRILQVRAVRWEPSTSGFIGRFRQTAAQVLEGSCPKQEDSLPASVKGVGLQTAQKHAVVQFLCHSKSQGRAAPAPPQTWIQHVSQRDFLNLLLGIHTVIRNPQRLHKRSHTDPGAYEPTVVLGEPAGLCGCCSLLGCICNWTPLHGKIMTIMVNRVVCIVGKLFK